MQHVIHGRRHFAVCIIAVIVLTTIGTTAIEDQSCIKKPSQALQQLLLHKVKMCMWCGAIMTLLIITRR